MLSLPGVLSLRNSNLKLQQDAKIGPLWSDMKTALKASKNQDFLDLLINFANFELVRSAVLAQSLQHSPFVSTDIHLNKSLPVASLGLYHPLDGATNLKYKLLYFLTPNEKNFKEKGTSF
jgi:hypothetical protein